MKSKVTQNTMTPTYTDTQQSIKSAIERLAILFDAPAAAAWRIDHDGNISLVVDWHASPVKNPIFRQQLSASLVSIPRHAEYLNSVEAIAKIEQLVLKTTVLHNVLLIPIHHAKQTSTIIAFINLSQWNSALPNIAKYAEKQLQIECSLSQQLHQQQRQIDEMTDQSRQWQAIYTGVQESIVMLDLKGKVLTLNPATEHITGYSAQEMIGHHIGDLFPKVGPMGSGINFVGPSGLYQTLAEQRPSDLFEAIVETKDKRHIWVNYTYTPLWDGNGKIIGLVRVTSDVSTIKNIEQMKNDFVSIASHELRTPLGVISSYLNLFLAGQLGELTKDQLTFMERIYHSSADMSALVEDLLNISRIEAGRLEVSVQTFDLDRLLIEVLSHLELRSQSKSLAIQFRRPSSRITIKADRQKIEQALTNIIDNAIKYTYERGTITIQIKEKAGIVEISVKDTGVGINPEHIGHIFEKFFRDSNPLSIREGGSGLGLYISRKLIELHGGSIAVASKPQLGSTFTIRLPITTDKHTT